jgi:hypothetical protein
MEIKVLIAGDAYSKTKDVFKTIREDPQCAFECPEGKPAKTRCKKCKYSNQFKFVGSDREFDYIWRNKNNEVIKAKYNRDEDKDILIDVTMIYQSPGKRRTATYKHLMEWYNSMGCTPEELKPEAIISPKKMIDAQIREKLAEFDTCTETKLQEMRRRTPLRPPAPKGFIKAYMKDRERQRAELERTLRAELLGEPEAQKNDVKVQKEKKKRKSSSKRRRK